MCYPLETNSYLINEVLGPKLVEAVVKVYGNENHFYFEDLVSVNPENESEFHVNFERLRTHAIRSTNGGKRFAEYEAVFDVIYGMNEKLKEFLGMYPGYYCNDVFYY